MRVIDADAVLDAWAPIAAAGLWADGAPPVSTGDLVCLAEPDTMTITLTRVDDELAIIEFVKPWTEYATGTDRNYEWPGWAGLEGVG